MDIVALKEKHSLNYGDFRTSQAIEEIELAQKTEGLFSHHRPDAISCGITRTEFENAYSTHLHQMVLDVTEHCNLRCHYCSRDWNREGVGAFERKRMSLQTAFSAIDFFEKHSSLEKDRALSFYGGEPLLEFDLIRRCVKYARSKFSGNGVHFALTTNGTLINEEVAKYLVENKFAITVSIDGPRLIHDRHRVDTEGMGCYDRAIAGLRQILEAYGTDALDKVLVNMVVTPPYDLDALSDLWKEQPWLPKEIITNINYAEVEGTNFREHYMSEQSMDFYRTTKRKALSEFKNNCLDENSKTMPVPKALNELRLLRILKRPLIQEPRKTCPLNGCCILGVRRVFVTCDGQLKMCEKALETPVLGSLHSGYDPDKMWGLMEEYAQNSSSDCTRCWVVNLCTICFDKAYIGGKFDLEKKRAFCRRRRNQIAEDLKTYCSILEMDHNALNYMDQIMFE